MLVYSFAMLVLEGHVSETAAYSPPLLQPVEGQTRQHMGEKSRHDARQMGDLRCIDSASLGRRLALVMDKADRARRGT